MIVMNVPDHFGPAEQRRQARLERLGTDSPACRVCGESDDRVLQRHHLAGQAYGDELVPVCANCHYKLSDAQADHPDDGPEPPFLVALAHHLLGRADFDGQAAAKLRDFAKSLLIAAQRCPQPWGFLNESEKS
jgi:hypothetical protein